MQKHKMVILCTVGVVFFSLVAAFSAVAQDERQNEAIIERNLEEVWHKHNWAVIDEIIAPIYLRHLPGGVEIRGKDAYRKHVEGFVTPFPDFHCTREIMFSKGDYVVIRDIATGTHTGPGMGEPTGKKINISAIVIHRLAAGKMVECWVEVDSLSLMQQLGYKLVPPE